LSERELRHLQELIATAEGAAEQRTPAGPMMFGSVSGGLTAHGPGGDEFAVLDVEPGRPGSGVRTAVYRSSPAAAELVDFIEDIVEHDIDVDPFA
jgi:hypothetical protein